jgi:hypothetical protein
LQALHLAAANGKINILDFMLAEVLLGGWFNLVKNLKLEWQVGPQLS